MGKRELVALLSLSSCYLVMFVFLVSNNYCMALQRGVMGLSAVCDCGMFLSYSLNIVNMYLTHVHVNVKETNKMFNLYLDQVHANVKKTIKTQHVH